MSLGYIAQVNLMNRAQNFINCLLILVLGGSIDLFSGQVSAVMGGREDPAHDQH